MAREIMQAVETVLVHPKTAQIVTTATAGLGAAQALDYARGLVIFIATLVGLAASVMIFIKNRQDYRLAKARRLEEILDRQENGLPTRRHSDQY